MAVPQGSLGGDGLTSGQRTSLSPGGLSPVLT
jgi:hypothetical protein